MKKLFLSALFSLLLIPSITFAASLDFNDISVQCGVPQDLTLSGNVMFNSPDMQVLNLELDDLGVIEYLNQTNTNNGNKWTYSSTTGEWTNTAGIRINSLGNHSIYAKVIDLNDFSVLFENRKDFSIAECPPPAYRTFSADPVQLTSADFELTDRGGPQSDKIQLLSTALTQKLQPSDTLTFSISTHKSILTVTESTVTSLKTTIAEFLTDSLEYASTTSASRFDDNLTKDSPVLITVTSNYLDKPLYYKVKNKLTQYLNREPTETEILNGQSDTNVLQWLQEDHDYAIEHPEVQHIVSDVVTVTPIEEPYDFCPNIDDFQTSVPKGYELKDWQCVQIPVVEPIIETPTNSVASGLTYSGGGSMLWCSGPSAPGWQMGYPDGNCGIPSNTHVASPVDEDAEIIKLQLQLIELLKQLIALLEKGVIK